MIKWLAIPLLATIMLSAAASGQVKPPHISTPPVFMTIEVVNKERSTLTLSREVTRMVPQTYVVEVKQGERTVNETRTRIVPKVQKVETSYSAKTGKAYGGDSKELSDKEFWKRAKRGTIVAVSGDNQPVDASYFRLFKKSTLVLVPAAK